MRFGREGLEEMTVPWFAIIVPLLSIMRIR